jgi:hypothetical protein
VAGTVGGVVGTGSSLLLMPVLVLRHGPVEAVPVMAIAAFLGNLGRVVAWRRMVDWRAPASSLPAIATPSPHREGPRARQASASRDRRGYP